VRSANLKLSHPQIDASDLAIQIRNTVAHTGLDQQPAPIDAGPLQEYDYAPATLILTNSFEPKRDDCYAAAQLLKFNDAEFIDAAYRAILKREPDEAGARFYLQSLRQGRFDKLQVILSLLSSEEGKRNNIRIEGLAAPLWLRRISELPVVGFPLRCAIDFIRAPILIRRLEQLSIIGDTRSQQISNHLNQSNRNVADGLAKVNARVRELSEATSQNQDRLSMIGESTAAMRDEITRSADATRAELRRALAVLESSVSERARTEELVAEINDRTREIQKVREELVESASTTYKQLTSASTQTERLRQEIATHRARLTLLEQGAGNSQAVAETTVRTVVEAAHHLDALYAELEDHFRGSSETLRQSFEFYLPYVQALPSADLPVVDLGCGRGEWLAVLQTHNAKAIGVDTNRIMIESCREASLTVVEADALAYLHKQPENSLRAVSAFHLIEHLPFEALIALFDQIMRTLQPGGVAIFETPNPDNLFVASNYFYHDPTHRNPLPSRLAKFLVESRGFARVEIINLHECAEGRFAGSDEVSVRLNELFYGPMDYAIVGWKHDQ
jgi:SAM-dependent methyltransferase